VNLLLKRYNSVLVISTFDQEIIESVCNRLIEIKQDGTIRDKQLSYEEYIEKYGLDS
jgi:ATPase subunit of ABC transporter with duplicated ATPase domains